MPRPRSKRGRAAQGANGHASQPEPARGRKRLPLVAQERAQVPCLSCGLCCTYVAIGIDGPETLRGAGEILWYLYHHRLAIYFDGEEWMVQVESRCQHLLDDRRCAIYERRPPICRAFDETICEVNAPDEGTTFYTAAEFVSYLAEHHRRVYGLLRKRYLPDLSLLNGHGERPKQIGTFRSRFAGLRRLGLREPARAGFSRRGPAPS